MRLLHRELDNSNDSISISLEESSSSPPYVILSHKWSEEELSFTAMLSGVAKPNVVLYKNAELRQTSFE